jgi:hypothetical protein
VPVVDVVLSSSFLLHENTATAIDEIAHKVSTFLFIVYIFCG